MDWQQVVSLAIIAIAGILLVGSRLRRRKFSFERETHCGCSAAPHNGPQSSIVFRARKGERARVVMKLR